MEPTMKFKLDINLDDQQEAEEFIELYRTSKGRLLANRLGLTGVGSSKLATALSNYAWNKVTAINCRTKGFIDSASAYESICDRIYKEDIQPHCECW